MRGGCFRAKGRVIEHNHNLVHLKEKAKNLLLSEVVIAHRKRRCWDVEAAFGNIKQNMASSDLCYGEWRK
ncbi:transposase [Salinimicrobium sp. 3283s]|uniref:transposase n=1 Tax=Salinimicrobium sp. 3283s TaxID=3114359 RepID=UPI0031EDCFCF